MLKETELSTPDKVSDNLVRLLTSPDRLATMSAAALTQAHPRAAEEIADRLVGLNQSGD